MSPKEINEKLLPHRKYKVLGEVNGSMQEDFCTKLEVWLLQGSDPITLIIDSSGGDLFSARAMIDAIRFSTAPIHALVTADAGSSAFQILQACHHRSAYPSARFMFHYGSVSINLDVNHDPVGYVKQAVGFIEEFLDTLARLSGESIETIRAWAHEARRMNATEALRLKFIDEILVPPTIR